MTATKGQPQRKTMTAEELAATLGVSPSHVSRQAKAHGSVAGIPAIRIGRRVLFSRALVAQLLNGERTGGAA